MFLYVKKELQYRRYHQELSPSAPSVACKNGQDLNPVVLLSSWRIGKLLLIFILYVCNNVIQSDTCDWSAGKSLHIRSDFKSFCVQSDNTVNCRTLELVLKPEVAHFWLSKCVIGTISEIAELGHFLNLTCRITVKWDSIKDMNFHTKI